MNEYKLVLHFPLKSLLIFLHVPYIFKFWRNVYINNNTHCMHMYPRYNCDTIGSQKWLSRPNINKHLVSVAILCTTMYVIYTYMQVYFAQKLQNNKIYRICFFFVLARLLLIYIIQVNGNLFPKWPHEILVDSILLFNHLNFI